MKINKGTNKALSELLNYCIDEQSKDVQIDFKCHDARNIFIYVRLNNSFIQDKLFKLDLSDFDLDKQPIEIQKLHVQIKKFIEVYKEVIF